MTQLSEEGRRVLGELAARHGLSLGAVEHLLMALLAGHTTQAQFNHPELGGMGQWSQGGMIMVGDMFNNGLKARVDAICSELAALARASDFMAPAVRQSQSQIQGGGVSLFVPGMSSMGNWWPDELGQAASTGAQNDMRYAFFPGSRRLAIDIGGRMTVYDTRDHQIGGFSQQQGGDQSLSFTSQHGLVRVSDLDVIPTAGKHVETPEGDGATRHMPVQSSLAPANGDAPQQPRPAPAVDEDIFGKIERLAALHAKGVLTDEEFQSKKTELLGRI